MTPDVQILAEYKPGVVTVDGHADDWAEVDGSEFSLLPALDPDADKAYGGGKMTVKVSSPLFLKGEILLISWI